jgi:hypothetical protein
LEQIGEYSSHWDAVRLLKELFPFLAFAHIGSVLT